MARPRLGEKKKTHRVGVFFTAAEYEQIAAKAERAMLEPAEFLRRAGLGKKVVEPPPEANHEALFELTAIGRNLNQLLVLLRLDNAREWTELEATIERTTKQLSRAAKDLIAASSNDEN